MKESKKLEYYVEGMHCKACELYIEKQALEIEDIKKVNAVLSKNKIFIETNKNADEEHIIKKINNKIKEGGYTLTKELKKKKVNYKEVAISFLIALIIVSIFIILQKAGIVNIIGGDKITLPVVFIIGIVASLSSCMAIVGGLVLSISSTYAKHEKNRGIKPLSYFHISRIISFFILGGIIGIIGSSFTLSSGTSFVFSLLVFLVMLILGINLLDIFPFFRRLQLTLPKFLTKKNSALENTENKLAPVLFGISTFFLPCGFTQSMQIYSLTTGSFINGALTMLVFSLGTFPILALISFASVKFSKGLQSKVFFQSAGFIVLFFALINLIAAFTAIGLIKPILNF